MEINSPKPAALLRSPRVSLSLLQAITWEKLPVCLLKRSTVEKIKDASAGVLVLPLVYTKQGCEKTQVLQLPVGQLWGNASKLLLSYLGMGKLTKRGPGLGRKDSDIFCSRKSSRLEWIRAISNEKFSRKCNQTGSLDYSKALIDNTVNKETTPQGCSDVVKMGFLQS